MDSTPSQSTDASTEQSPPGLASSWTQIGKDDTASSTTLPGGNQSATTQGKKSFADVAGREKKLIDEFPTPGEAVALEGGNQGSEPTKMDDLLKAASNSNPKPASTLNPDRSFADVTSNEGFPLPEPDTSSHEDLSNLPSVKEMLQDKSVNIPPPPASKSFAKVAAKEPPPKDTGLSDRTKDIMASAEETSSTEDNLDNFPTLAQSTAMSERADDQNRSTYAEVSRLDAMLEPEAEKDIATGSPSFADMTKKDLEYAAPAPIGRVDQQPVYSEETILRESVQTEKRKWAQAKNAGQEHATTPEQKEIQREEEEADALDQEERQEHTDVQALEKRLKVFDRQRKGKFTIIDTISALRRLGYSWLSIFPITLTIHLRLSPLTSPHRLPFLYHSLTDLVTLPVYTNRVAQALTYCMPVLTQDKSNVDRLIETYGQRNGREQGLGFWDGFRAVHGLEKKTLRWWQFRLWSLHRFQWVLTYAMLHDPRTHLVSQSTMISLGEASHQQPRKTIVN